MTSVLSGCRALMRAPARRRPRGEPYGWDRITAGAGLLDALDPGWWREDATPAVDVAALNMADPHTCLLGQRFARPLPPGPQPYGSGLLMLGVIMQRDAVGLGFTGVDADLLTHGWRRLICARRAGGGSRCEPSAYKEPVGWRCRHPGPIG
jgi:hypothetical protein